MAARYEITDMVLRNVGGGAVLAHSGASVAVKDLQGNNLTVYQAETGSSTFTNPLTSDSNGQIEGWVEAPDFDLAVSGTGISSYTQKVRTSPSGECNVKSYGAKGDGSNDDTAAINAAKAALPTDGGMVVFPAGRYRVTSKITVSSGQKLVGAGGSTHEDTPTFGPTTLVSEVNGTTVEVANQAARWSIDGLSIKGDRTLASQDLLVVNTTNYNFPGYVRDVVVFNAGRDGLQLNNTINVHFDFVRSYLCKRNALRAVGNANGCNANKFTKCLFRTADQWGVYWERGSGSVFDNCTIESNSQDGSTTYGGFYAVGTQLTALTFVGTYWENNDGADGTGPPLRIDADVSIDVHVTEVGSKYTEQNTNPVLLNGGYLTSVGITTTITPHATIGASAGGARFFGPFDETANFSITDTLAKSIVIGGNTATEPAVTLGDVSLYRSSAGVWRSENQLDLLRTSATSNGFTSRVTSDTNARFNAMANGQLNWGPGNAGADVVLSRGAQDQLTLATGDSFALGTATGTGSYVQFFEQTADPSAPAANGARLFAKDNGAGKTQLVVRFNSGATQVIATEP